MPSLDWRSARAICCKAWAITPPAFDTLVEEGQLSLGDVIAQVDLETLGNPRLFEYAYPGFLARMKQRRYDQQNAAAFQAMWEMAQRQQQKKNKKKGAKR